MSARLTCVLSLFALLASATEPNAETARWWSHVRALANDRMEGRDTGSRGYAEAEQYGIQQLKNAGLKPAGSDGFRQPVPLEFTKLATRTSWLEIVRHGNKLQLEWLRGVTLPSLNANLPSEIDGPLYFVGDDSSLQPGDLTGKVVVLLSPPRFSSAPRAVKPASLQQAAAVFSIDTMGGPEPPRWPASYAVSYHLTDQPTSQSDPAPVPFRVNPEIAGVFFEGSGHTLAQLRQLRADGKPLPNFALAGSLHAILHVESGRVVSDNVLAELPGSDARLRNQYVVLSAHLDGYGRGEPWRGDDIYNGAFDDAAYVATLIDLAQRLQESHTKLKRSILFCIVTAEEKGLLGSKYFAAHPTVPKDHLVADLNLDQLRPIFPLQLLTVLALNDSSLGTDARQIAAPMGIQVQPDPEPERGLLRRSDHYSFMKIGVPALNFVFGFKKGTEDEAVYRAWYAQRYHSPADDLNQPWIPEAAAKFNRFYQALVEKVANASQPPRWNPGSQFVAANEQQ